MKTDLENKVMVVLSSPSGAGKTTITKNTNGRYTKSRKNKPRKENNVSNTAQTQDMMERKADINKECNKSRTNKRKH